MLIMTLMGLGLGGNMQPIILAVQNAASPREIGVSTSSVTFFRSMGGTLAAAAFLSLLFAKVQDKVVPAYQAARQTPEFQAAVAAHPDQAQDLVDLAKPGGGGSALSDTSFLNKLEPVLAHPFKVAFADSMSIVFVCAALIMVIGLVLVFLLPELPLRQHSAAQSRVNEDAADAAAEAKRAGTKPTTNGGGKSGPSGGRGAAGGKSQAGTAGKSGGNSGNRGPAGRNPGKRPR